MSANSFTEKSKAFLFFTVGKYLCDFLCSISLPPYGMIFKTLVDLKHYKSQMHNAAKYDYMQSTSVAVKNKLQRTRLE
jgi:hypothetical protein